LIYETIPLKRKRAVDVLSSRLQSALISESLVKFTFSRLLELKAVTRNFKSFYGFSADQRYTLSGWSDPFYSLLKIAGSQALKSYQGAFTYIPFPHRPNVIISPPNINRGVPLKIQFLGRMSPKGSETMVRYLAKLVKASTTLGITLTASIVNAEYVNTQSISVLMKPLNPNRSFTPYRYVWYFPEVIKAMQNILRIRMRYNPVDTQ
jgi:hypothetical protein